MSSVPIGPFVRFLIAAAAAAWSNWDTISGLFDRKQELSGTPIFGYYCQHVFEYKDGTGAFSPRERGMFGIHYVNSTGGDLDTTWIAADFAAVEAAVQAFWTANQSTIPSSCHLVEHRWYAFGPGVVPPNPPVRVTTLGTPLPGTGTQNDVHQAAMTVTLRTALRRHWGRIYLPMGSQMVSVLGQSTTGLVDALCNSARTMFMSPFTSNGIVPVVYDRNKHGVLGVTALEVDSVPDIIRRRRPRTSNYKKILTS